MYSRDFGGVRSDGQLREFENNWQNQYTQKQYTESVQSETRSETPVYESNQSEQKQYHSDNIGLHGDAPVIESSAIQSLTSRMKGLFNFNLDFLKKIDIDDLILVGIGILLLLDSDTSNDMWIILIAIMLFF
ncbi:MAG: hypothetical protein A2Y15_09290 [Clostridiales bacterium GWF2_36_10]|nr:MAG: hypothetical protein A2Y15_09290 [Clostridiales bacterium GWF2_36_10]HAN21426.1 hypothetical protein [Clostridiales bacterium]